MKCRFRISVNQLSCVYSTDVGDHLVLKDVSFAVDQDRVLCILGVNGSGKTTLVGAIAGLLRPLSGFASVVPVSHVDVGRPPIIALLHQDYRQTHLPWASVLENVVYSLRFRAFSAEDRRDRGIRMLTTVLPEVDPSQRAHELSGGQLQLLAIARALVSEPDVVLGDEPLSAADAVRSMRAIITVNDNWQQRPVPVMWISHNIDEALLLGDSLGLLSRRSCGFARMIENPIARPRKVADLARPDVAQLRTSILSFLLEDFESND